MKVCCAAVVRPTSGRFSLTPTINWAVDCRLCPVGIASRVARSSTSARAFVRTSTTGAAPDTVTVSSSPPTESSPSIVIVKPAGRSSPSRTTVENPGSVKVSV